MGYLKEILKGVLIGVANIVPGVSGGTLAVAMGIYDKIIKAVTHIARDTKGSVKTLLPYGIGAVLGVVGLSFVIEFFFGQYPLQTSLLFIGLIVGGIPVLSRHIKPYDIGVGGSLACAIAFFSMLTLAFLNEQGAEAVVLSMQMETLVALFFVGMIAAATMVVPGVSGTMILMILGYYQPVIASINQFFRSFLEGDWVAAWEEAVLLAPFGFGVLAGIFACAKLIEILLDRFEMITYCAIIGLVLSSPIVILSGVTLDSIHIPTVLSGLVCFGLACMASVRLSKSSNAQTER